MNVIKEFKDLTNFTSDEYIHINSCSFCTNKGNITILRSKGRVDYHFLYITKGLCTAHTSEGEIQLSPGDMLIYKPYEKQMYVFEENYTTEYFYIHFAGCGVPELMKKTALDNVCCIHAANPNIMSNTFEGIVTHHKESGHNLKSISYLLQLMCLMSESLSNTTTISDNRIDSAIAHMHRNYSQNHALDFYAKMCNLSTTRFSHLFKSVTGKSPHRYITDIRLSQVKHLLESSDMNISEIAHATGFDDPLYMSRIFKAHNGMSPTEYIKKHR
ncbi:MAG: helix-turn-helix transcriptional regulator [Clostridia bacterium]|nr:helix-turn-helix transcriptional regulator [Clostridia bacterium]